MSPTAASVPSEGTETPRRRRHQQELLTHRRCCHCAEIVSSLVILKSQPCPKCGRAVAAEAGGGGLDVVDHLARRWKVWRWVIYPLTAAAALATGWVPFVAAILRFVGLLIVHIALVRRPILWLSASRRMTTRFTLRLSLAAIAVLGLLIDVLMIPWPGANAAVALVTTFLATMVYAEGALWLVSNRLRREVVTARLDTWEWIVPASLVAVLVVSIVAAAAAVGLAMYVIKSLQIPLLSGLVTDLF